MNELQTPLASYWSASSPFVAQFAIQQLRNWVANSPWFDGHDHTHWFDLPATALEQLQSEYQSEWLALGRQLLVNQPFMFLDKRFAGNGWSSPFFGATAAYYLLNAQFMLRLMEQLPIPEGKPKRRLRFILEQTIAASAPSNFLASNPDALQHMLETQGASLVTGMMHLASDMLEGRMRQCDRQAYRVGRDLATSPGSVIFENPLFQLIQYRPSTPTIFERPLLIVPPAINKFYILDLRPENSMIRHLVDQGHQVFVMSWRNFGLEQASATWDDFVQQGVLSALKVVREVSGQDTPNCMGFCIGGSLLTSALAVEAARGAPGAASLTLLASFLDYFDTGLIDVFIDEQFVQFNERTIGGAAGVLGIFRGTDMANTFSLLRPNELWWNYHVSKYLKGLKPAPLDLLFWNSDSTNLPGKMYCWYLRHTYLENGLKSGLLETCGVKLDLRSVEAPAYVLGAMDDHIVPWKSAYASTNILSGPRRFVLTSSGHIAGVINPPGKKKRHYWVNTRLPKRADTWFKSARELPGSWWGDWFDWLQRYSGGQRPAPTHPGAPTHPAIEDAPGRYVLQ